MSNQLAHATSPYLQQHASNPVDWMEWGEAAFERARTEGKPIFLSIGYSTCHWCHVMAHESFENEAIAAQLNADFVGIKVDREERPDVDRVYMAYVQAVTGSGGWPLSVWLTPELKPFFGGTYFPPEDRDQRPGLPRVLESIADGWRRDRERVVAEGTRVVEALAAQQRGEPWGGAEAEADLIEPAGEAFEQAYTYLLENFDEQEGGLGGAPKFPRPASVEFLLRCAVLQDPSSESGQDALRMVMRTLEGMARGGIYDHVGGGFHRYAVDAGWFVPHFEKMLYDQAQIAVNLIDAFAFSGDERLGWVARGIFEYVGRDLVHPDGGVFSAEDADSVVSAEAELKREGAFYVWSAEELAALLGDDAAWFGALYGIGGEAGNVPARLDPQGELGGWNVLKQQVPLGAVAVKFGREPDELAERLGVILERLREVRAGRPRPHRDEKIIAAWNGLMIAAWARGSGSGAAALVEGGDGWRRAAERAAEFVRREMWDASTGILARSWRNGRPTQAGFAEDYAAMIFGLLELYEAAFSTRWLRWADELQQVMDARFWDDAGGGYFQTQADDASIVLRMKDTHDGAEPAANSLAAANLLRLGALLHDDERRQRGMAVLRALRCFWGKAPWSWPAMLVAMEWAVVTVKQVVLGGDLESPEGRAMAAVARSRVGPRRVVLGIERGDGEDWLRSRLPAIADLDPGQAVVVARVCANERCFAPVHNAADLAELLGSSSY